MTMEELRTVTSLNQRTKLIEMDNITKTVVGV